MRLKQLDVLAELLNMRCKEMGKLIDDSDISSLSIYDYVIQ